MKELIDIQNLIKENKNIFLTGGAGVGKSFLLRALIASSENEGKKVAKLASTGMAASLIGGQTLHSFFDLGICSHTFDLERVGKINISKKLNKLLKAIELIVIDEISMVSSGVMDMIRLRLLQAESKAKLVISGDFLQLPPVIRESDKNQFRYNYPDLHVKRVYGFAFESESWQRFEFETICMNEVKRTADIEFINILDQIRTGVKSDEVREYLIELTKELPADMQGHTLLFGKNVSVDRHNTKELHLLDGLLYKFETAINLHVKNVKDTEVDRFLNDSRLAKVLELKVGVPVLFMRNSWNYFNGEKGVITAINEEENYIHVLKENGKTVRVEKEKFSKKQWMQKTVDGKKQDIEESRFDLIQYPLSLAYAITIHKSQGMSLLDLVIDMNEIFAPSQFYVAISRAVSASRLILLPTRRDINSFIFASSDSISFYDNL